MLKEQVHFMLPFIFIRCVCPIPKQKSLKPPQDQYLYSLKGVLDLKLQADVQTDEQTDGQIDGKKVGQTDRQTDRHTDTLYYS